MRAQQDNAKMHARYGGLTDGRGRFNRSIRLMRESLDLPLRVRKPTTWAVWNDLFHGSVSDGFIAAAFGAMAACPQHVFVVLTKRAKRMLGWFEWASDCGFEAQRAMFERDTHEWCVRHVMRAAAARAGVACPLYHPEDRAIDVCWPIPNVILGVTAENQKRADERIPWLLKTPAAWRMVSYEPALDALELNGDWLCGGEQCRTLPDCELCGFRKKPIGRSAPLEMANDLCDIDCPGYSIGLLPGHLWPEETVDRIDWLVAGCESGPRARETQDDWLRSVRDQCVAAGVPFFLKQQVGYSGKLEKLPELDGRRWDQMPEVLR